jgi:hypothetical protein
MRSWLWIGLVALVAAGACASGERQASTGEDRTVQVTVENDLQPPTSVTVYIGEQIGTRRTLGDVGPLDTRTFSFELPSRTGNYRLVARTTSGEQLQSDRSRFSRERVSGGSYRETCFGDLTLRSRRLFC